MTLAVDQPQKDSFILLRFKYGESPTFSYKAYTDWTSDVIGNPTYVSTPGLEIKAAENLGHVDKAKTTNIAIPYQRKEGDTYVITDAFINTLISGVAHSPVFVELKEMTKPITGGAAGTQRWLLRGRVIRTSKNHQGVSEKGVIQVATMKSRLGVSLGVPAEHHCPWILYDSNTCLANKATFTKVYTIQDIDGKMIRTSTTPAESGDYFFRGWLEYDGIRIGIQQWDGDGTHPDEFFLVKQPPISWLGKPVAFIAGCDKTIQTCRTKFNREQSFGGSGYAMLPYNPILEDPQSEY